MHQPQWLNIPLSPYLRLLAKYLRSLHLQVFLLALLVFTSIALQLINPQIISTFIDAAIQKKDAQLLIQLAVAFLAASTLLQGVNILATYVGEDIGWRSTNRLREDLTRHCLRLDSTFLINHTPGELIERIDGDVTKISFFFSQFVIRIAANGVLLVGVLVVLLWQDWRISLALTLYAVVALIGLTSLNKVSVPQWKASQQANADLFGFLGEQLVSTEDIRPNGATGYVMHHLYRFCKIRLDTHLQSEIRDTLIIALWFTLRTAGQFVALLSSYTLYHQGLLSLGSVYLIILYTEAIFHPHKRAKVQ